MKQNILITGAKGFVGSAIFDYLEKKNYNIYGIVRNNFQNNFFNKHFWTLDDFSKLENQNILSSIDTIIHAAGRAHIIISFLKKNKDKLYNDNINLTKILADIAIKNNIKKFVYISTAKVYGEETYKDNIFYEKNKPKPTQAYSISKHTAELKLLEKLKASSTDLTIIRPPMIFGKVPKGNLKILIKAIKNNIPIPISKNCNQRSFLSLENLCLFIESVLINKIPSNSIYNISDGIPISTKELTDTLGLALNKKVRYLFIPDIILKLLLKLPIFSNIIRPLFNDFVIKSSLDKKLPFISTKQLISKNYSKVK